LRPAVLSSRRPTARTPKSSPRFGSGRNHQPASPRLGFRWPATKDNSGPKENNLIWRGGPETHNFAPFKDKNPACPPRPTLQGHRRDDHEPRVADVQIGGWHSLVESSEKPVVTKGAFDSHNTAFWDAERGRYAMYVRVFSEGEFKGL